jgi:hypothetical protein
MQMVTADESRAGVLCLCSGHSKLWALLVVVNLWNDPGFQFDYSS